MIAASWNRVKLSIDESMIAASWNRVKLSIGATAPLLGCLRVVPGCRALWYQILGKQSKSIRIQPDSQPSQPVNQPASQPAHLDKQPASKPATSASHPASQPSRQIRWIDESMIAANKMRAVGPGQPARIESRNRAIVSSNHRVLERSAAEAVDFKSLLEWLLKSLSEAFLKTVLNHHWHYYWNPYWNNYWIHYWNH